MLNILGSVIQRKSLSSRCRERLKAFNDCLVCLSIAFSGKIGDRDKPALALGQCILGRFVFSGDQDVAVQLAVIVSILNGYRPDIYRNPVGNLGFSLFSADAFDPAFLVGTE